MKQQFTGSYTLNVASRTIVLSGVEIPQARLAVVINSTAGFVYHNIEHEPTASVTISGGNTTIVFPRYKDCETHRNTDALSIFYDDGVDLGQLIKYESDETQALLQAEFNETQTAISGFRTEVKAESDETQALLQSEFNETQAAISGFRTEVKAESDETQALLQTEFDDTRTALTDFSTEVKAETNEAQALLQAEFDETQVALADFRAEVKAESDETQALLQAEFDETQTAISGFRTEVKAESDETQALLQAEFDETQTAISGFRTEVKAESDELQTLLGGKLPTLVEGMVPAEALNEFSITQKIVSSVFQAGVFFSDWYWSGGFYENPPSFNRAWNRNSTFNQFFVTSFDPVSLAVGDAISVTYLCIPFSPNIQTVRVGLFSGTPVESNVWNQFNPSEPTHTWRGYTGSLAVAGPTSMVAYKGGSGHPFFTSTSSDVSNSIFTRGDDLYVGLTLEKISSETVRVKLLKGPTPERLSLVLSHLASVVSDLNVLALYFTTTDAANGDIRYNNIEASLKTYADVDFVPGGYGPSQIVFSKRGEVFKALNLTYGTSGDSLGKVVSITPAP